MLTWRTLQLFHTSYVSKCVYHSNAVWLGISLTFKLSPQKLNGSFKLLHEDTGCQVHYEYTPRTWPHAWEHSRCSIRSCWKNVIWPDDKSPKSSASCYLHCWWMKTTLTAINSPLPSSTHSECNLLIHDLLAWASSRAGLPLSESAVDKESEERDSTPISWAFKINSSSGDVLYSSQKANVDHSVHRGSVFIEEMLPFKKLSLKTASQAYR